jgi:branched-chain amino acid transport system substrate-binding protein
MSITYPDYPLARLLALLLCVLCGALILSSCDSDPVIEPSGKTITIGVIGPMTGNQYAKGIEGVKGIKTIQHMYPYLDNGDAIELLIEDDKNEPDETVRLIHWMAEEKNVSAILLLSSSASALKAGAEADTYSIPILTLVATHTDITKDRYYISQISFDNDFQGRVAAHFVRDDLLLDKVAVIYDSHSFHSTQLAEQFIRTFESADGRITDSLMLEQVASDYEETLQSIQAKETELIYIPLKAEQAFKIITAASAINWSPMMMGGDGMLASALAQHKDQSGMLNGIYATEFFSNRMPFTEFGSKVESTFKKLYDSEGTSYTGLGAEGYKILMYAMNRCTSTSDRQCINDMIRSTNKYTGLIGRISITANGKAERPLVVNQIINGHMQFVVKVY